MIKLKNFFNKKKKNSCSYDEEERHVLSSAGSISTGMSLQKSRATLITSQIASENNPSYELDLAILFKEIEDPLIQDEEIILKISHLKDHDDSVLKRIKSARISNDSISLLHSAAKNNRANLCTFLIDSINFDPDIQSKRMHKTPLHSLIGFNKKNIESCFKVFTEREANVNLKDETKTSLLHLAVRKKNLNAVSLLLETKNINLNIEDDNMLTPLHVACELGVEEIAILLINNTEDIYLTSNKNTQVKTLPIHSACGCKSGEQFLIVQTILNRLTANEIESLVTCLDAQNKTALQLAIDNNHLKIIDLIFSLASNFQQLDISGNMPIHYAAKNGTQELFNLLEKYNLISLESNSNNETALHIATIYNRFSFVKMLLNYEKHYMIKNEENTQYIPLNKCLNKHSYTALQIAIIKGHEKCVEEITNSANLDLDIKNANHYSIYHLCVYYSNLESLRFLLNKKSDKFLDPLFIKSKTENETPIHLACRTGQLEAIKLILIKLANSRFSNSIETYLREQNTQGQTCFHLACLQGYFNIIEYFLKDFKISYFLELTDNYMNTCLLNATQSGHLKICQILLENGADLHAINIDLKNALLISCQMKHFEISKILIKNYDRFIEITDEGEHPIHMASYEGAHEVVKLLLDKGVPVDLLNQNRENCFDIAISQNQQECLKVLLAHKEWQKLFKVNDKEKRHLSIKERLKHKTDSYLITKNTDFHNENPQLIALFDKKMWNILEILLNNCIHVNGKERTYNLNVIDPAKFHDINRHPLMLLTRSGQENLLMHEITNILLSLKWRFLPRLAFYSNMMLHFMFLVLFVCYSSELIELKNNTDCYVFKIPLVIVGCIKMVKNMFQIGLMDGLGFFFMIETWLDLAALTCSGSSMLVDSFIVKTTYCSIGMMCAFLNFTFLIEKVNVFGLYVLAFRRTIQNSAKFFPVFLLIYCGFVLSFRTRTASNLSYFNDTASTSMIKGLTMMLGDFKTDQMGVNNSLVNYLLYLLFIVLVSIIVLNLFVGIAVGEVSTVLAEATVQQISIRIIFVLKLQFALHFTQRSNFFDKLIGMTFSSYNYNIDETKLTKKFDNLVRIIKTKVFNKDAGINLIDPNTRLEEKITTLYLKTDVDCKLIKDTLTNQIGDVEQKFKSSHQRLEDYLAEMSRKSLNNFESTKDDSTEKLELVQATLIKSQSKIQNKLFDLSILTSSKLMSLKQSFVQMFHNLEDLSSRNYNSLTDSFNALDEKTNYIRGTLESIELKQQSEFRIIKNNSDLTDGRLNMFQLELGRLVKVMENIENKLEVFDYKLNVIDILVRKETFSAKLDLTMQKLDDLMERQFEVESTLAKIKT